MSWISPMTAVAGSVFTASQFNVNVRDNLLYVYGAPPQHCDAYHSTTQNITPASPAVLAMDNERVDTGTMHDTSTNNSRITIPTGGGGTYWVFARTKRGSGAGSVLYSIRKNGTNLDTVDSRTEFETMQITAIVRGLVATDYLEHYAAPLTNTIDVGSATAALASRLVVLGPLPAG